MGSPRQSSMRALPGAVLAHARLSALAPVLPGAFASPIGIGETDSEAASRREGATHRLGCEALDDVAFLEVVEVRQPDAALEARRDLADIVPEAAERLDPIGRDDLAAAPDPRAALDHPAVGDV